MSPIRRLHDHRIWANHNLLAAAAALPPAALHQEFPIGQGSIWKSLVHMYAAEYVWLHALLGDENPVAPGDLPNRIPGNQQGPGAIASLAELQSRWRELDGHWQSYLESLAPEALDGVIYKVSSSAPDKRFATRREDVLLHVCTHAHYTAAQVVNMLRQLGVKPLPETMLITLARQQPAQ